jgi:carotenoid cleavage dioxygenase-like enzyme
MGRIFVGQTAGPSLPGWGERQPEVAAIECEVVGAFPPALDGALYRLGGAWYYPPKFADDVLLHADGIVSAFRITGGRVSYAARYVETERLSANREAERMRFGYYRNRLTDDPDVMDLNASAANTTAFAHGGRLLALKEDSLPYEIDPITLETRGLYDFGGRVESVTFTAHPKIDGRTGEMVAFGYQARGNYTKDVHLWTFAPDGTLRHEIRIEMPWLDMIHDMAITENHILLPLGGYVTSVDAARAGGAMWRWDPDAPARIGILRRDGNGSDLRWFTGPKTCQLHTFNAWEEDGRILLDAPFYCGNPFPFLQSADGSPWKPGYGKAHLRRLHFDLGSTNYEWREERLFDETIGDLGDIDPRFVGRRHRYCFGAMELGASAPSETATWVMPNAYVRFDVQERQLAVLNLGPQCRAGECRFIPRGPGASEGDGWLIGVVSNTDTGCGELVVADAQRLEQGPVGRALLPFPAAPQVHGCWVAAGAMDFPQGH